MRKIAFALLGALLALAGATPAWSQCQSYTQVTGTVKDANNIPYSFARLNVDLFPSGGTPTCTPASGGTRPQFSTHVAATLDVNGTFAVQLPPNSIITPGSTQWTFTVSIAPGISPPFGTGPQTFAVTATISGSSQSMTSALTAAALALTNFSGSGASTVSVDGVPITNPNFQDSSSYFYQVLMGNNIQLQPQLAVTGNGIGIVNGNFESPNFDQTCATQPNPPVGWSGLGATAGAGSTLSCDTTTPPPNNGFSFKLHCTTAPAGECDIFGNTFWTVIPGQTYTASAYLRSDGTVPASICLNFTEGNNVVGDQQFCTATTSNTWTLVTVTGAPTGTQDTGDIDISNNSLGPPVVGDMWAADVQLYNNSLPNFTDVKEIPAPSNPVAPYDRTWLDNSTHQFSCKTPTGTSCFPTLTVLWNNILAPSGNLSLGMGSNTSSFQTTSAVSQFFSWKNVTAATVSASQASPILGLCGRAWIGSDTEDCLTMQITPGNGANAPITINFGHSGSSTGTVTTTFAGPIQAGAASSPGAVNLPGNSSGSCSVLANNASLCGPNTGSFTNYSLQFSATGPAAAGVMQVGAPSSNVSQVTFGQVPISLLGTAGLSGTSPIAISAAGAISCTTCTTNAAALTNNVLVKGAGGQATQTSSITDNGTNVTTTDTGGYVGPTFTANGTTAGFVDYPQGSTSSGVAPCNTANSICEEAPAAVTAYVLNKPGAAPVNNNSAALYSNASPGVGAFAKMPQTAITSGAAYTNATTTFSSVVGGAGQTLSFSVEANTNYLMSCQILWSASAATAGPKIQITGPASPTAVQYSVMQAVTATSDGTAGATAFSTSLNASGTTVVAATNEPLELNMGLVNGANAGTVTVQAAAQGAGTLTIQPGSFCQLQ